MEKTLQIIEGTEFKARDRETLAAGGVRLRHLQKTFF